MYHNEREVGQAVKDFLAANPGVSRDEIWYTTKLASNSSYDATRKSINQSLQVCGLDRIDLFLLHSPYGGKKARLESWKAVEDAIEAGEVTTGGVSNYGVKHVRVPAIPASPPSLTLPS
jgi:diketogulonate reductase-like aldo/keto reductase